MKEYYEEQLKDQPMKVAALLGQGCFTHDFLAVLMTNTPTAETMNLVDKIQSHTFSEQIDLLKLWAKARFNRLMSMKNLTTTMTRADRESSPQKGKTDTKDRGIGKKAEQAVKDALRKFNPAMAQMSQAEGNDQTKSNDKNVTSFESAASKNNKMFMRMFASRLSGKEQTEVIPPLFKEAASLIKHDDFSEKEKLSLTYGMAHYTGCLVCQALLNKFGARAAIFPHLFLFNRMGRFPMVRYCPNLLRMPIDERIQLVEKLPEEVKICKACSTVYKTKCNMCEHPRPDQRRPACKGSGIHPIFCACNDCTQKIDRWKAV